MNVGATGWPASGSWSMLTSQITAPPPPTGTGTPRNHYYPSGVIRPLVLGPNGLPLGPVEVMVIAGGDSNVADVRDQTSAATRRLYGRPALAEVSQIAAPETGSSWSANGVRWPNLTYERVYANAVMLPDGNLYVVGGSKYDHYPYAGGDPTGTSPWYERIADPVFVPEMLDLFAAAPQWQPCAPHISPRLYHSVALLLKDGRVLVAGGYRGKRALDEQEPPQPILPQNWLPHHYTWETFAHSDIEIFSPDYLFAGARPQIVSLTGGGTTISYGTAFEINVALPGSSSPAAEIGSVSLITPGSVTHHFGWDQRYVGLSFAQSIGSTKKLTVQAPAHGGVAPPGWYMLFITTTGVSTGGTKVPSIAMFVKLQ